VVLGPAGIAGLSAVQAARRAGADRVVAAGRRPERLARAREAGADAAVELTDRNDLAETLAEACGGDGPTVVVDPLWDGPLATALAAAAPGARVVHIGQSAGTEGALRPARGRGQAMQLP